MKKLCLCLIFISVEILLSYYNTCSAVESSTELKYKFLTSLNEKPLLQSIYMECKLQRLKIITEDEKKKIKNGIMTRFKSRSEEFKENHYKRTIERQSHAIDYVRLTADYTKGYKLTYYRDKLFENSILTDSVPGNNDNIKNNPYYIYDDNTKTAKIYPNGLALPFQYDNMGQIPGVAKSIFPSLIKDGDIQLEKLESYANSDSNQLYEYEFKYGDDFEGKRTIEINANMRFGKILDNENEIFEYSLVVLESNPNIVVSMIYKIMLPTGEGNYNSHKISNSNFKYIDDLSSFFPFHMETEITREGKSPEKIIIDILKIVPNPLIDKSEFDFNPGDDYTIIDARFNPPKVTIGPKDMSTALVVNKEKIYDPNEVKVDLDEINFDSEVRIDSIDVESFGKKKEEVSNSNTDKVNRELTESVANDNGVKNIYIYIVVFLIIFGFIVFSIKIVNKKSKAE